MVRIACNACGFIGPLRSLGALREDDEECRTIVRESLERASVRILSRRFKKTKKVIMRIIHRMTARLPDSATIAQKFRPAWSGILVCDGKVVKVYDPLAEKIDAQYFSAGEYRALHRRRWLCGIDYGTGDLPHYALAESENKIDLVLYFQTLKSVNYPMNAVVSDGNPYIIEAARFVYGDHIIWQRCTRHFIEDLKRLLPTEESKEEERAELEGLISLIQRVIEADTLEESGEHLIELRRCYQTIRSPLKLPIAKLFKHAKQDLTAHLLYPELHLPHTSNDIENLFKQLMLRIKSIGRFHHQEYARDYLNAWALWRRFTPFTDCKRSRKHRNKKAPLQLAGCEITNIDFLTLVK